MRHLGAFGCRAALLCARGLDFFRVAHRSPQAAGSVLTQAHSGGPLLFQFCAVRSLHGEHVQTSGPSLPEVESRAAKCPAALAGEHSYLAHMRLQFRSKHFEERGSWVISLLVRMAQSYLLSEL